MTLNTTEASRIITHIPKKNKAVKRQREVVQRTINEASNRLTRDEELETVVTLEKSGATRRLYEHAYRPDSPAAHHDKSQEFEHSRVSHDPRHHTNNIHSPEPHQAVHIHPEQCKTKA